MADFFGDDSGSDLGILEEHGEGDKLDLGGWEPSPGLKFVGEGRKRGFIEMEAELLPLHVRRSLQACEGWVELGDMASAQEELESVAAAYREHPDVLRAWLELRFARRDWEGVVQTATRLCALLPTNPYPFLRCAYALHELKRTVQAWDVLRPVAEMHSDDWVIPYNLACYAAQMGRLEEARAWLQRAYVIGGEKEVKRQALEDPDLAPLWKSEAEE